MIALNVNGWPFLIAVTSSTRGSATAARLCSWFALKNDSRTSSFITSYCTRWPYTCSSTGRGTLPLRKPLSAAPLPSSR